MHCILGTSAVLGGARHACSSVTCPALVICSIGISFDRKTILGSGLLSFLKLQDDIFQVQLHIAAHLPHVQVFGGNGSSAANIHCFILPENHLHGVRLASLNEPC